jgi:hypothetical protein
LQEFVVTVAVTLKIEAQVEQRLPKHAALAEQEREQEPSQTPIAIQKRMDGLELHMHQAELDQQRQPVVMEVLLEGIEALHQRLGRRRYKKGIAWPASTNPVLTATKFAWSPLRASAFAQEHAMNLAEQAQGDGKPLLEPLQSVFHGRDIIGCLAQIVHQRRGTDPMFEEQQFGESRLRPFNLRGDHGLFANIEVEK